MALSTICLPIQHELKRVDEILLSHTASDVELVANVSRYTLQNGGKRIRPALTLLSSKMLGFTGEDAVYVGAAIEMIHAASLMHDDVLDNASLRRGKPSANVKWGNQTSILVGDFLWCRASNLIVRHGNERIISAVTNAVEKTTEGEIAEIVRSNDFNITEEEYLQIIRLKTAMLFACSCQIGAMLAGASEQFETALKNFGFNLGIAFQLADDVLDYTAIEERFGKRAGTDMCEGRLTLPVILALKRCHTAEFKIIKDALLANTLDIKKFSEIISILKRLGTLEEAMITANRYSDYARKELAPFKPSIEKESLEAMAVYAVSRKE